MVGRCIVCQGRVLCVMAVYYMSGRYTVLVGRCSLC